MPHAIHSPRTGRCGRMSGEVCWVPSHNPTSNVLERNCESQKSTYRTCHFSVYADSRRRFMYRLVAGASASKMQNQIAEQTRNRVPLVCRSECLRISVRLIPCIVQESILIFHRDHLRRTQIGTYRARTPRVSLLFHQAYSLNFRCPEGCELGALGTRPPS